MHVRIPSSALFCALVLSFSALGCAAPQEDRFESINRPIQSFNDQTDRYLIRPVAVAYAYVMPDPLQSGVTNFFENLGYPLVILNQGLQGKPVLAVEDTTRFLVNSTLGVAGLFDVASGMGLRRHQEDFGQTFGVWGVAPGDYLVLPLWGSVTVRDGIGDFIDTFLYPPRYLDNIALRNSLAGLELVNLRADLLGADELVSGDRYIFFRDSYLQRREYLVNDGAVVEDAFLDDDF
ncbi:MAG TPA: VacJ family lipoprotein [Pseudomonadales bacterium]|nr:VacJ family lipoprotein [Pseudomonadales bacterium]